MKPIRNILTRHDEGVFDIKNKIEEISQKNLSNIQGTLPTEDECKLAFSNTSCSALGDNKASEKLKRLKDRINSVRQPVNINIANLEKFNRKIDKLVEKIKKLEDLLELLNKLTPILKLAAEALPLVLIYQAFPGPGIQATVVIKIHEKIEAIKAKLAEIAASIKTYLEEIPPKYEELEKQKEAIDKGIEALKNIKVKADELILLLELSYVSYLQNCALGSGGIGNDGLIDDNNLINLIDNLTEGGLEIDISDLLGELENQGQVEVIAKIFNSNLEMIGYRRYKA